MGVLGGQDSGLEILHGREGGDVELGARTSEHIIVFAFDPLSLNSLSLLFVHCIIHIVISYLLAFVPCIYSYCLFILYAWFDCVCLTCT